MSRAGCCASSTEVSLWQPQLWARAQATPASTQDTQVRPRIWVPPASTQLDKSRKARQPLCQSVATARTMIRRTLSMCFTTLVVMRVRKPARRLLLGVGAPSPLSFPDPAAGGVLTLVEGEAVKELKSSSISTFCSSGGAMVASAQPAAHSGSHSSSWVLDV